MEIVMNTSNSRQSHFSLYPQKTDAQIQAEFADLVMRACRGDRRAIGAIYVAFGPVLLREARSVMGAFKQDAEEVVQDFFVSLLEGRSLYVPAQGYATRWMCGVVRAMAKTQWAIEPEP